ncbi:MAG: FHA domain-containing protein [Verrucomicrobiota bacterium]
MSSLLNTVLVVTVADEAPRCFQVDSDVVRVGRSKHNHLQIDHSALSNTHCEFVKNAESDHWIFRDLGSTNGSRLNGTQLDWDALLLSYGDEVVLGKAITIHLMSVEELEVPESMDEGDSDVNPVAAAMARQSREDLEGTQLIKLPPKRMR